jgi:hypothetical protein
MQFDVETMKKKTKGTPKMAAEIPVVHRPIEKYRALIELLAENIVREILQEQEIEREHGIRHDTNPRPTPMPERHQKRFMSRQEISSYLREQYGIELSVEAIRQRDYRNQGPGGYLLGRRRVSTPEQVDQWVTDVLLKPIRSDL